MTLHLKNMPVKPDKPMGCSSCIYNSMFLKGGESHIICDSVGLDTCEKLKEVSPSDNRRVNWEAPDLEQWRRECKARAASMKGKL